ncbi:transmembrane secretion effector [Streptomyces puniciscabiei]|uniref:Transmembrane secretion effector n=1 Tax=Streptomyces puniciscabiei TaxID=164348 RepID=A0A542THX3_9ACTN|nr:transmembrane secretion effector [Streptomyces puniciscabiei]
MLAARLPRRFGHGAVLVSAAALGDGGFLCVPALHGPSAVTVPVLLAVNFVFGTFSQLVNVTVMAVRQTVTPEGMQGRAAATINFVGMGTTPLGSLLGGLLAEVWGTRTSLLVTAAGMLVSPALNGPVPTRPPGTDASRAAMTEARSPALVAPLRPSHADRGELLDSLGGQSGGS